MKKFILFLVVLGGLLGRSTAQICPTKLPLDADGSFDLIGSKFCIDQNIRPKDSPSALGIQNIYYIFDYKPGTDYKDPALYGPAVQTAKQYIYTKPGKYCIIQIGSKGSASFAAKEIEVLDTPTPVTELQFCDNYKLSVDIGNGSKNKYDYYEVNWGDQNIEIFANTELPQVHTYANNNSRTVRVTGVLTACNGKQYISPSFQPVLQTATPTASLFDVSDPKAPKITVATIPGVKLEVVKKTGTTFEPFATRLFTFFGITAVANSPLEQFPPAIDQATTTCLQVVSYDGCGVTKKSADICSIPFKVTVEDGQNVLAWTAYPISQANFKNYTLTKNAATYKTIPSVATAQDTDKPVDCNKEYTYQMTVETATTKIILEPKKIKAINNQAPPSITEALPTVEKGKVVMFWLPPTGVGNAIDFTIYRGDTPTSAVFEKLTTQTSNRYEDPTAQPSTQAYCYKLNYQNECGRESASSKAFCTMHLSENGSSLSWTPFIEFASGLAGYYVEYLDQNGSSLNPPRVESVGQNQRFTPNFFDPSIQAFRFRVRALSSNGLNSYSNDVMLSQVLRLFVPEAFTPNNDGENDSFLTQSSGVSKLWLRVFNRWGEVIYETDDRYQGWNGLLPNGQLASIGAYSYRIDVDDFNGKTHTKTGTLMLLR